MKKDSGQSGFAITAALLILLLAVVIGFGGYYVWNEQQNKDETTNEIKTTQSSDAVAEEPNSSSAPQLIDYRTGADGTGVVISVQPDTENLTGASSGFKNYVWTLVQEIEVAGIGATSITIDQLYGDTFAVGMAPSHYALWANVNGTWQEIGGTQDMGFSCSVLEQYDVPSIIVHDSCVDENGLREYSN